MTIFYLFSLGLYEFGLSKIKPIELQTIEINFKDEYHDALWSEYAHSRQKFMTEIQPYEYLLRVIDIKKELPDSTLIAAMCARVLITQQNKVIKKKD